MLGAIAGDIIGSVYEHAPVKTKNFPLFAANCRFTDDTVLTIAVADAVIKNCPYLDTVREYGRSYPDAGYGASFLKWLYQPDHLPYNSWGNGSAMRVSPIGWAFDTSQEVLIEARKSAEITHNHPEGVKGAQAVALAVFLARQGTDKEKMREILAARFHYDLKRTVETIRPGYSFDISCQGTVPEALLCFFDSVSYEDALRNAVSLGGDSDTLACITGSIAEAFYGSVPDFIQSHVRSRLPLPLLNVVEHFERCFPLGRQGRTEL